MARRLGIALVGDGRTRALHRQAYQRLEGVVVRGAVEPPSAAAADPEAPPSPEARRPEHHGLPAGGAKRAEGPEGGEEARLAPPETRRRTKPGRPVRNHLLEELEAALADPAVDAVCVLAPPARRAALAQRAAEAGRHVSVEAPMARTLAECDALIAACEAAGVTLQVFQSLVFYPPVEAARALLQAGEIGEPLCLRARFAVGYGGWRTPIRSWAGRLRPDAPEAGATILDDGCHELGLALDLLGPVVEVTGWMERTLTLVDSHAALAWRHRSGALGYLDAALTPNLYIEGRYLPADERVQIAGTEGTINLTGGSGRPEEAPPLLVERDGRLEVRGEVETEWARSFEAGAADFVEAIRTGGPPRLSPARGRAVTAFAQAAVHAGRRGGVVRIEDALSPGTES